MSVLADNAGDTLPAEMDDIELRMQDQIEECVPPVSFPNYPFSQLLVYDLI